MSSACLAFPYAVGKFKKKNQAIVNRLPALISIQNMFMKKMAREQGKE